MILGLLMLWEKEAATIVENPDITVGSARKREKVKEQIPREKVKVDFMDTKTTNKNDGIPKVLEKAERMVKAKGRASKGIAGIVAKLATDQMNAGQSRKYHLTLKQLRLGEFSSWHALKTSVRIRAWRKVKILFGRKSGILKSNSGNWGVPNRPNREYQVNRSSENQ
jgi:hypothetical protein